MPTVLISGAGVAGSALAYWLARHGFTPTVVERTSSLRERTGGHAVDVFGPAVDVVERMSVLPEVHDERTRNDVIALVRPGKRPIDVPVASVASSIADRHVEILRGTLARILFEAASPDVEYVFGDAIRTMTQDAHGVDVTFERAGPRRFDLVVGADGLHSQVRHLAFGGESRFLRHAGGYLGVFSLRDGWGLDRMMMYLTPGRLSALYPVRQTGEARALFVLRTDKELVYDRSDPEQQRRLLREHFSSAGWQVPVILDALDEADDFYFDAITRVAMDTWSRARVTLVGDAGYAPGPAVGGGTSLALVGAYVLAGELAAAGGDHAQGFAGYEREIGEFAHRSGRIARSMISRLVPASRPAVLATRTALAGFGRLPLGIRRWIAAGQPGPADALSGLRMRDY